MRLSSRHTRPFQHQKISDQSCSQVLTASVHDFRYFAALLRGVNFVNVSSSLCLISRVADLPLDVLDPAAC